MNLEHELNLATPLIGCRPGSGSIVRDHGDERRCVLRMPGDLLAPLDGTLRGGVRALLGRGERLIVLDLSRVSRIDAAGTGDLVRAFNTARRAGGALQITHASPRVQRVLDVAGLFDILREP